MVDAKTCMYSCKLRRRVEQEQSYTRALQARIWFSERIRRVN